jgi:uncharacterized protein (DUF1800 family)
MINASLKNRHLIWRTTFGITLNENSKINATNAHALYKAIEQESVKHYTPFTLIEKPEEYIPPMQKPGKPLSVTPAITKEQVLKIAKRNREDLKNLTLAWLNEMTNSPAQLREKFSLFWHGHFACRINNIYYQQHLLNEIRKYAIDNFGSLLSAVSKSPAMLLFLNNQQNRKQHPNENFAREVMELFTLGRGNYTETDVKEAARAFTGWGFERTTGSFVFRKALHDEGVKNFLGKKGNFNGDDILNILLEQRQTATFITQKIYRYFVNEKPDNEKVEWLAKRFYENEYNLQNLLRDIFTSNWFFNEANTGSHIKSPVEFIVGIRRALPMELENPEVQLVLERVLGQLLFNPPNVAGWPGGNSWIDSSTLMLRLRIPQLMKDDDTFVLTPKPNDDIQMGINDTSVQKNKKPIQQNGFQIVANINWEKLTEQFTSSNKEKLYEALESYFLQVPMEATQKNTIIKRMQTGTLQQQVQTATVALMSTPEYQLC